MDCGARLCAGAPDVAATLLQRLVRAVPTPAAGTASHDRAAQVARLQRDLDELGAAEERFIDEAAASGIAIAHRPDVVQRRDNERRACQLEAERVEQRAAREQRVADRYSRR